MVPVWFADLLIVVGVLGGALAGYSTGVHTERTRVLGLLKRLSKR